MKQNSTTTFAATDIDVSTASSATTSETTSIYNNKKEKHSVMTSTGGEEGDHHGGRVAVHSQVIKIKQEIDKVKEPSPEIRRLLLRDVRRQRSRSPLGISERAILVGNT